MIEFRDVAVRYGSEPLFEHASFKINAGERVGIVGPNGSGKSTLFKLILGEMSPDAGDVLHEGSPRIGFVRQHLQPAFPDQTLLQYCLDGIPGFGETERTIARLEEALTTERDSATKERMLRELGEAHTRFEQMGGYTLEARVKESLGGLGYETADFEKPFATFSGGWRMRAELSRVLASKPELLLLDEPSNYLDLPAIEWLQRFLRAFEGTLVLISHDRYLLRAITRLTLEVDGGTVTRYNGPLDYYLREREVRYRQLLQAKANQDRKREQLERFIERFRAQATKAAQAQSREKQLEKLEEIRLPARSRSAGYLRLPAAPHAGAEIVRLDNAAYAYPGSERTIFSHLDLRIMNGEKIAIVGYNGMGKTTLLRLLAGVRAPTEGSVTFGYHVEPGYQSQDLAETMNPEESVFNTAKAAAGTLPERDLRNRLGGFGFDVEDCAKPVKVLSGGEKIRLAFVRLFLNPPNFLLLDEPTTHLDLEGREKLQQAVRDYNGTVVLVSHDVEFVRGTAEKIIEISHRGVRTFPGGYDYYLEKTAAEIAPAPEAPAAEADAPQKLSSKDLRRQRAQERAAKAPEVKRLKRRVAEAEAAIAKMEAEQDELTEALGNGTLDAQGLADAGKRLRALQFDLAKMTLEWEEAATALEALE
ncbi:MAG: ABC-F family ATP-binding cassette domain-containing protein [Lentisphaeraceae bacterium]|nr:ABC-F family ATP-binding cassette domain-containing protein [Lentisphaeraceae bacterium]